MIMEILFGTAATVAAQPRVSFPTEDTFATSRECGIALAVAPASVSAVQFVNQAAPTDMIRAEDLWDTPFTIDQALSLGNALMTDGTSDFIEID
jgi:hypothetical protein